MRRFREKDFLVEAPVFFGESCLYVEDSKDGTTTTKQNYTATCKTRVECVVIEKEHIELLLNEHPFLLPKFQEWQRVMRGHRASWMKNIQVRD